MAKRPARSPRSPTTVDAYLAAQPDDVRAVLDKVRATLRKALPGAEEVISYGIPAYKLGGRVVVFFAGWKQHWALYPLGELVPAELDLSNYELAKGTIRFPHGKVPVTLITRIARLRAKEVAAAAAARKRR